MFSSTLALMTSALAPLAQATEHTKSEFDLALPDLSKANFLGLDGHTLLLWGMGICVLGIVFGLVSYKQLRDLPVHKAMLEISELIYATCKTYLMTQIKFIVVLEVFIGSIILAYFGLVHHKPASELALIIGFSLIGIAGSVLVAAFGIRVNTFANSRTAFAALRGKPYPVYQIPLKAGMSIGMLLISIELLLMLFVLLFIPSDLAYKCFLGFAIGESLGASALRIAGGIFTKIADIGSDLMKIVFKIKEDDARNPGVIADCTGDNAGDSVGPTADGFETYGVTGVALISFILLAVPEGAGKEMIQTSLIVWLFAMRVMMIVASGISYLINEQVSKARFGNADHFDFEAPLTFLVWLTSFISIGITFAASYLLIPTLGDGTLWWKLSAIITCGTLAGAIIPEVVKVFTSTESRHVRECVEASKEGGASLNVLAGLTAGNFSAYWMGVVFTILMGAAWWLSADLSSIVGYEAIFAFGLVAFGFLGMGPVTIAVDSYGPVTDNAQSVYELSLIEEVPNVKAQVQKDFGFAINFEKAKEYLEENDGAGNTFKATAKPVLIGTAVVGATTMIFATIMALQKDPAYGTDFFKHLSLLNPAFLLGMIMGGSVIYWFTGASTQAVSTGAYRAVEFIKKNMKLDGAKASTEDSKKVVEICTVYAQKGMFNIFLTVFFSTLAFAFYDPFFFIGYLIAIALFGLFQAIFMANAGGAWDNAKKVVETELRAKNTPLHAASIVGDTVGDPFKDTSSVAMNPVIKFTTLFGLLAVELAVAMKDNPNLVHGLALGCFLISSVFVWRSFYAMRIKSN
ncbi:MAG: sodium-translocating pyrophosphatase [Planctomycetes bacterium]|nr:sodium-translocating pyrophosphatase [Planctomycetota bacterium]